MTFKSYRDLEVWREAMRLIEMVYAVSASFPPEERFGLTAQLRRASISVASNIAEGHARPGTRDFLRFIGISLGSLAELETQVEAALRLGFTDNDRTDEVLAACDRTGRMLRGLHKSLTSKLAGLVPLPPVSSLQPPHPCPPS